MLARVTRADGLVMDVNPNSIDIEKQLVQFGLNEYILPNSGAPHPAGLASPECCKSETT